MSRNTWTVAILESGGTYTSDGTIYVPNEALNITFNSNHTKVSLADGSFAFMSPETKYNKGIFTFVWREIDDSDGIITKLEGYVESDETVKITTHLSHEYIGKFTSIQKTHLLGITDTFDIEAIFEHI